MDSNVNHTRRPAPAAEPSSLPGAAGADAGAADGTGAAGGADLRQMIDDFISAEEFPCVAAKAANSQDNIELVEADDIRQPMDDVTIYRALESFGDRVADEGLKGGYQTLMVVFSEPADLDEADYETALWNRLQSLHNFDAVRGERWDQRVDSDPASAHFSMSIGGRAYFVVGLHPRSSRPARRFPRPAMVFNLHEQFERLREAGRFERLRSMIRQRDRVLAGDVNPMVEDFDEASEANQYSGRQVGADWECPLEIQPEVPRD